MKKILVLAVLALITAYYFRPELFSGVKFSSTAPEVEPVKSSATHDFSAISALLQQDMNNIPASLNGNAPRPVHAYDVKRKVRPHAEEHAEYQTLLAVCDLIIQADAERSSLQNASRSQQTRTTFHSVLDPVEKNARPAPNPVNTQAAIQQRVEGIWSEHRTRIAGEVARLLDSLKGKTV